MHEHKWRDAGKSLMKGFEGLQTFHCECGAVMFEGCLQPELEFLMKKFNKPKEEFNFRMDGRVEWVCEHGVGHTIWHPKDLDANHGCDGCCNKLKETL